MRRTPAGVFASRSNSRAARSSAAAQCRHGPLGSRGVPRSRPHRSHRIGLMDPLSHIRPSLSRDSTDVGRAGSGSRREEHHAADGAADGAEADDVGRPAPRRIDDFRMVDSSRHLRAIPQRNRLESPSQNPHTSRAIAESIPEPTND